MQLSFQDERDVCQTKVRNLCKGVALHSAHGKANTVTKHELHSHCKIKKASWLESCS